MFTYLFIFIAKVFENSMATLRLILVSNGKKMLGAILNFIISIAWVISAGLAINNINEDPFKIVVFAFGCFVGSYIGSLIEEKIAIGSNMLYIITKPEYTNLIKDMLDTKDVNYTIISKKENILIIMVNRKDRKKVLNIIYKIDNEVIVISEVARQLILNK